jgi:hypothetical protein
MYLGLAEFQLVSMVRIRRLRFVSINTGGINFSSPLVQPQAQTCFIGRLIALLSKAENFIAG